MLHKSTAAPTRAAPKMAVVLGVAKNLSDRFWNPRFWLPGNVTWDDLRSTDEVRYVEFSDLLYPIPLAILILVFRFVFER